MKQMFAYGVVVGLYGFGDDVCPLPEQLELLNNFVGVLLEVDLV